MNSFTELLANASWLAAPIVAYQALMHGLRRALRPFAVIYGIYAAFVMVTLFTLEREVARDGTAAVTPIAVLVPWMSTSVLCVLFLILGFKGSE